MTDSWPKSGLWLQIDRVFGAGSLCAHNANPDKHNLVSLFLHIKSLFFNLFLENWFSQLSVYSVLASVQRAML